MQCMLVVSTTFANSTQHGSVIGSSINERSSSAGVLVTIRCRCDGPVVSPADTTHEVLGLHSRIKSGLRLPAVGRHRLLLRRRTLFVLAIIVGVTATDWPLPVLNGFWLDHPIVAGVVSGILLLVFAAIIVEGWLEERETERWSPVAAVIYRAIANEARDVRVRIGHYVDGSAASWWPADHWMPAVQQVLDSNEHALSGLATFDERIDILARDPEWRSVAWEGVRYTKRLQWDIVAKWAPAVAGNPKFVPALEELTTLNDQIAHLQMLLDDSQGTTDVRAIAERWQEVVAETYRIERNLINEAANLHTGSVATDVRDAHIRGYSGRT